ncbi:CYTH domain-containing protein [Paenibacillus alkaliterrae]|uniref:CYTH domain-containing protein n=1 Tax=Paenibacillus alkaliterrae TaxID=320909 RepID=UPI001F17C825|nr:CYTH domain-containing protein [Paenibacillus alkaliterrae]MCF2941778.1 CYTH domain-containing protein [Paenibacillus alkaliterrae]
MSLEIERKFLLADLPSVIIEEQKLKALSEQRIEQTYLAMDETQELRVRRIVDIASGNVSYTHTFKLGNGISREEIEYSISEGIYEQVVKAFGFVPLTKNRITAEWAGKIIEIDIYDQIELAVLEMEFESEEAANAFAAPDWFGKDISSERQYSNKKVWRVLQGK